MTRPQWAEGVSAPVLDWHSNPGAPPLLPWAVAMTAWQEYAKRYGGSSAQTLEQLCKRGGLYVSELDSLHPRWKQDCRNRSEIRSALDALEKLLSPEQRDAFARIETALHAVVWPVEIKP